MAQALPISKHMSGYLCFSTHPHSRPSPGLQEEGEKEHSIRNKELPGSGAPLMPVLRGKYVPNLNPSVYWVTSPRPGSGRLPGEGPGNALGAKGKKGPPKPSQDMAFTNMPCSGHSKGPKGSCQVAIRAADYLEVQVSRAGDSWLWGMLAGTEAVGTQKS